jgi:hypothetical protein
MNEQELIDGVSKLDRETLENVTRRLLGICFLDYEDVIFRDKELDSDHFGAIINIAHAALDEVEKTTESVR